MLDATPVSACTKCYRALRPDEDGRYVCRLCERRTAENLLAIPGLYARLDATPGRSSDGPAVSGSRGAGAPLRLGVLNLQIGKGPVLGPLELWVRDWETYGHAEMCEAGTLQQRVEHAVRTLRFNLDWAVHHHPAVDEFAKEIDEIHGKCFASASGEPGPRRVTVLCAACGNLLRISADMDGVCCPRCQTCYGHQDMLDLTAARRAAA